MTAPLDALQATLAAEHAAVWTYALLGARTSESGSPTLYAAIRAAYSAHHQRRDDLTGEIAALGATPVAAAAAYAVPAGLDTDDGIMAAALALEQGCADTYAALVAATAVDDPDGRRRAIGLLNDGAVRGLSFRGTPEIFPGAAELKDR